METRKETEQNISIYFDERKKELLRFFVKKTGDKDSGEELFGEFFKNFTIAVYKNPRPKENYPKLETLIKRAVLNDYYRRAIRKKKGQYKLNLQGFYDWIEPKKKKGQKQKVFSLDIKLKDRKNEEPGKDDEEMQRLESGQESEEKKKLDTGHREWQLEKVLLNEIKPIQEVAMISLAKNFSKLKYKITEEKFPYVAERYKKMGHKYETFLKKGKKLIEFLKIYKKQTGREFVYEDEKEPPEQQLDSMNCDFSLLLHKIAGEFKIKGAVGIDALKILLLSENFWRDLGRLSQQKAINTYKKDGKDSETRMFRNFYLYNGGLIHLNKFLEGKRDELDKKLEENTEVVEKLRTKVSLEDIKKSFKIGPLNSRVSKEAREYLRKKVNKYEESIEKIMGWL